MDCVSIRHFGAMLSAEVDFPPDRGCYAESPRFVCSQTCQSIVVPRHREKPVREIRDRVDSKVEDVSDETVLEGVESRKIRGQQ